jgi:adenine deaminase
VVNAFVSGFGYTKDCAVASTVAHDSHQMIVVGTNKRRHGAGRQPAGAGRRRRDRAFAKGEELALVELPIAGLMSDERAEIVAAKAEKLVEAMRDAAARSTTPTCSTRCWRWW